MKDRFLKYVEICERVEKFETDMKNERIQALMDIESADIKFNLRLDDWLNADDLNFMCDYRGIRESINRNEFPATDFGSFIPQFAGEE